MENKIKNFKDLKIWQKSPVPERGNDNELDKMSLTIHYSLFTAFTADFGFSNSKFKIQNLGWCNI